VGFHGFLADFRREHSPFTIPRQEIAMRRCIVVTAALFLLSLVYGQQPASLSKEVQKYVRVQGARVVLAHVRIIDGTGRAPTDDQNVVLEGGEITAIQPGADMSAAKDTTVLDLRGYTVIPGNRRHA
jgi:hypothetical protein